MRAHSLYVAILLGICSSITAAEDQPARNADGQRIWRLNNYLNGTSDEIRNRLSAEVKRLKGLIADVSRGIADEHQTIDQHKALALSQARNRPEYLKAQSDAKVYEEKLSQARAARDTAGAMENGRLFNNARDTMARIEREAARTAEASPTVKNAARRLADKEARLNGLKQSLADAMRWREEVAGATRNSFTLTWPLDIGETGTLGEITPKEIDGDGNLVCAGKIKEMVAAQGNSQEGITTFRVRMHPAMVIVKGARIDRRTIQFGQTMWLDQSMAVLAVKPLYDNREFVAVVVVEGRDDDLSKLMTAVSQALAD